MTARRTKPSTRANVGRFWILIVAIAVLLFAGAVFGEFWPGFYPRHIVVSGNARIDRATILQAAAIARHRSIWLQSIGKMATRVAAIPFVERATIHRYPPATIVIRVTERVPFAIARRGDDDALIDDTLRVLQDAPMPPRCRSSCCQEGLHSCLGRSYNRTTQLRCARCIPCCAPRV